MKISVRRYAVLVWALAVLSCVMISAKVLRKPVQKPKAGSEGQATMEHRLAVLDVKYEILLKDNPPQSETIQFRLNVSDARNLMNKGQTAEAETRLKAAESWMESARTRFYSQHKEAIARSGKDTEEDFSDQTLAFLNKSREAKEKNDTELQSLYMQAAIEAGELDVLTHSASPEGFSGLIQASKRLIAIYREAGDEKKTREVEARDMKTMLLIINNLKGEIDGCLDGRDARCTGKVIAPGPGKSIDEFYKGQKWLNDRNILLRKITEEGNKYYSKQIAVQDYGAKVSAWSNHWDDQWKKYAAKPNKPTPDELSEKQRNERKASYQAMIEEHNRKYCQGAVPAGPSGGSEVEIVYQGHELRGTKIVIKGHVKNISENPIYNPKVTICGEVVSEVERLGFYNLNQNNMGGFAIELKDFGVDEFRDAGFRIPRYRITAIFQDYYGTEKKAYVDVK